jgi:hypothetical protein
MDGSKILLHPEEHRPIFQKGPRVGSLGPSTRFETFRRGRQDCQRQESSLLERLSHETPHSGPFLLSLSAIATNTETYDSYDSPSEVRPG